MDEGNVFNTLWETGGKINWRYPITGGIIIIGYDCIVRRVYTLKVYTITRFRNSFNEERFSSSVIEKLQANLASNHTPLRSLMGIN